MESREMSEDEEEEEGDGEYGGQIDGNVIEK